jgi:hypothetical protein
MMMTMNLSKPNAEANVSDAMEYHWKRHKLSGLPPGVNLFGVKIPVREFSQDKFKPEGAYQVVVVAGRVLLGVSGANYHATSTRRRWSRRHDVVCVVAALALQHEISQVARATIYDRVIGHV